MMNIQFQNLSSFVSKIHKHLFFSVTFSVLAVFVCSASISYAEQSAPRKTQGASLDANIKNLEIKNGEVVFQDPTGEKSLKKHGEGVRKKKVAILNVDVYKIALYTHESLLSENSEFKILESPHKAVVMTPLRNFGGDKLQEALVDSYKVNSVDAEQEAHKTFMKLLGGTKVQKGEDIIILGTQDINGDTLYLKRGTQFESLKGHDGFVNEVFAVWLGKTVDKQLESVKQSLLQAQ